MRQLRSWRRGMAVMAVVALAATACSGDDDAGDTETDTGSETEAMTEGETSGSSETETGTDSGAAGEVATGTGITEEPCPNAVNADNGCIYLGILSDLTQGPFAPLGVEIVAGQEDFWQRVNEQGGIAGYDVDVTEYTRDNLYTQDEHVARYREIEPNILALAQSLGTPPTLAALSSYIEDNVLAAPASWWSGWSVPEEDSNVILESGYPYCIESMDGLDWWTEQGNEISTVMSVGYPGDYGGDGAAGAQAWTEANGAEFLGFTETGPNSVVGNQDAAVGAILQQSPDVVQMSVGPTELGEIVGKAVAQGFEGQFIGSVPTWNPALLESAAAEAIQAKYIFVAPWGPFGSDSAAHDAMAEAVGDDLPANDGYTFGWIWSYPLLAVLQTAADNGDLTREGLVAAVDGLEVDYEGALPTRTLTGSAEDDVVRTAYISQPDPEAPLGASVIEAEYTGPTAEGYEFTEACASAG
jgi:ABC-type branched-subunit amino acid transport system substrate-binding protein